MASDNIDRTDPAKATVDDVERIVVETEQVIDALVYNAENKPDLAELAYFSIEPPAEGTVEPEIDYIAKDPTDRPSRPKAIRLRPERFVKRSEEALANYSEREDVKDELGEDATEAEIEEEHEQRVAQWREKVRDSLVEQVELVDGPAFSLATVDYQ